MMRNKLIVDVCIICGKPFTEVAPSLEHIIPEVLGNEKITTYCVCELCNNQLGTRVDAYVTNHILTKFIRQQKLLKDRDIQLFDSVLFEKDTDNKYKVYNDRVETIARVLEAEDVENNGVHLKICANSMKEAIEQAKKKIRRLRPNWSEEEINLSLTEMVQ